MDEAQPTGGLQSGGMKSAGTSVASTAGSSVSGRDAVPVAPKWQAGTGSRGQWALAMTQSLSQSMMRSALGTWDWCVCVVCMNVNRENRGEGEGGLTCQAPLHVLCTRSWCSVRATGSATHRTGPTKRVGKLLGVE